MTFVAGPYSATYQRGDGGSAYDLGVIEDGFEIEINPRSEPILGDNMGDTPQDGVVRGGECYLNFVLEYALSDAAKKMIWPYAGSSLAGTEGVVGQVGSLLTSHAGEIILTPILSQAPWSIMSTYYEYTFYRCVIPDNFPIRQILAARLRKVPLRMLCLPELVSSYYRWYSAVLVTS